MGGRNTVKCLAAMSAVIVFVHTPSSATTIVALRTPDTFAIAADSLATVKSGTRKTDEHAVSKLFQKNGVVYAVSGLAKDPVRGFDVENLIADSLSQQKSFSSTVKTLETLVSDSLKSELSRLQREEPLVFSEAVESLDAGTSILLASRENGEPVAVALRFLGAVRSDGHVEVDTVSLACPGDCRAGKYIFLVGSHKAIDAYVREHGSRFTMPPDEIVRFLVQLEIDAKTPGVGPPIDVAVIDTGGFRWISQKEPKSPESR